MFSFVERRQKIMNSQLAGSMRNQIVDEIMLEQK